MNNYHAVRWARRKVRKDYQYSKWHLTDDACSTICSVVIPIALNGGTFLPEVDDDTDTVTCKHCIHKLRICATRYD